MNEILGAKITSAVRRACKSEKPLSLCEPYFIGNEKQYLINCIDTNFVSYVGEYVVKFEKALTEYTGAKHALALVNGTCALQMAIIGAGVLSGEEVLLPTFTFIATANAVSHCNAIPHFIDIEPDFLGICPIKLLEYLKDIAIIKNDGFTYNKNTGRKIVALVVMHTFGFPVHMAPLMQIAKEYNLQLIEDAAQSLGSFENGVHTGNFGIASSLSFNGNKIITTGGGGAVITNDDAVAKKIRHISTTAKKLVPYHFVHDEIGYNYRMSNINAALGCAQMESLELFLANKRNLTERYKEAFKEIDEVKLLTEKAGTSSNYWLNVIVLKEDWDLQKILEYTNKNGIGTRAAWNLLHMLPMYQNNPRANLDISKKMFQRVLNIPSSSFL